jgi:hypothetical protein
MVGGQTNYVFWLGGICVVAGWNKVLKMNIKGELTTFGEFAFYNTHRTLLMSARK